MLFKQRQKCFCAFCKTPRQVYKSKYLSIISISSLSGLSLLLSYVIWQTLDPRGLFILAPILLIGELFSQSKWRQSMVCRNCGFDVITYKQDPTKCAEKIRQHIATRSERPEFLLRAPLNLPASAFKKSRHVTPLSAVDKADSKSKGNKLSLQV